jgi:predicted metal-dependent phosphoesterase TrpH
VRAVIHVHTSFSFDSMTAPKAIVDKAIEHKIDVLCITDHDTIEGSQKAFEYAQAHYNDMIKIVIGAEFSTEWGDIIGINIKENIDSKNPITVIENIKKQGGLVLLPHPFDGHKNVEKLAELSDVIEVFNARSNEKNNEKSLELAQNLNKPCYVASDAHFLKDSMLCKNDLKKQGDFFDNLLKEPIIFETQYSKKAHYFQSQMIKGIKLRKPLIILRALKGWLFCE